MTNSPQSTRLRSTARLFASHSGTSEKAGFRTLVRDPAFVMSAISAPPQPNVSVRTYIRTTDTRAPQLKELSMTTLDFAGPAQSIRSGIVTVQLNDDLWRITRPDGEVLGYVHRWASAAGTRYQAKRMLQRQRRFLPLGDFWTIDDALDIFRF